MNASKAADRAAELVRSGIVATLIPIFFLYVFLDKPDYKIVNAVSGVVVPAAKAVGDGLTWPFRIVGGAARGIRELSNAAQENEELRARLDGALKAQNECNVLMAENQRLERQIDLAKEIPQKTIFARVIFDHSAFSHNNFVIGKGAIHGVKVGQAVVSTSGYLAGVVTDTYDDFAKVRALSDAKSSVPVRVAGSGVFGFLTGMGSGMPMFEFFSDNEFIPTKGIKLVSSGIRGTLPNGIPIGTVRRAGKKSASVILGAPANKIHDVMVLDFDGKEGYR